MAYQDDNSGVVPFVQDDDEEKLRQLLGMAALANSPLVAPADQGSGKDAPAPSDTKDSKASDSSQPASSPFTEVDDGSKDQAVAAMLPKMEGDKATLPSPSTADLSSLPQISPAVTEAKAPDQSGMSAGMPTMAQSSSLAPIPALNVPGETTDMSKLNDIAKPTGGSIPQIGSATTPTQPVSQLSTLQQNLSDLQNSKSGVSKKHGFLGMLAKIGDVAGSALLPGVMMMTPGTTLNHAFQVKKAQGQLNDYIGNQKQLADINDTNAQAQIRLHPMPKIGTTPDEVVMNDNLHGGPNGGPKIDPSSGKPFDATSSLASIQKVKTEAKPDKDPVIDSAKIDPINAAMENRYQVLNPGKPLPDYLKLKPGATEKDFDRADKLMQQTEQAKGTATQQEATNAFKQQTQQLAKNSQADRKADREASLLERTEKGDMKAVIGEDKEGRQIFANAGEAKKLGLTGIREAGSAEAEKVTNARNLLPLFNSKDPDDPGLINLVDKMNKEGKLGVLSTRWNEFMSGKFGNGDPEFEELRTKMGLSTTALMQVHVGNRGGAFMLEHFEDLANSKKMDGPTLLAGLKTEANYIKNKAMYPKGSVAAPQTQPVIPQAPKMPAGATGTAMGSDGQKHWTDGKKDLGVVQ